MLSKILQILLLKIGKIAVRKLIIDKITGGFTSFLGNLVAERGGTVTANKPYIVGELVQNYLYQTKQEQCTKRN